MKIFIDVNVFIDVMTKRSGWSESLRVLNLARRSQEIESWTSALTLPLLYFFRRRVVDETIARADVQAILKGLQLVPMNQTILDRGRNDCRVLGNGRRREIRFELGDFL